MKNISDSKILKLTSVSKGVLVIPNQGGKLREAGNPLQIGNDIVFLYTIEKNKEQWLHYSYCDINKLSNPSSWKHKGKLNTPHQAEDPYIVYSNSEFIIQAEDRDKPDKFSICELKSSNWNYKTNAGTWTHNYKYSQNGGGMYSPLIFNENGKEYHWAELRYTTKYENIDIVDSKTRQTILSHSSEWNVLSTDYIYKIGNKYIQFAHGLRNRGTSSEEWVHFIAQSDNLLSGWKITNKISPIGIVPIYTDKWQYLVESSQGLCFGIPKYKITQPPIIPTPPKEENMSLNLKATRINENTVLLEWNHPTKGDVHFNDEHGYFGTKDYLANGKWEVATKSNKFKVRTNDGAFTNEWTVVNGSTEPPVEPPKDNADLKDKVQQAIDILIGVKGELA